MSHIRTGQHKDLFISCRSNNSICQYAGVLRCGISEHDRDDHAIFAKELQKRDLYLYTMIIGMDISICPNTIVEGLHLLNHLPVNWDLTQRCLEIICRADICDDVRI